MYHLLNMCILIVLVNGKIIHDRPSSIINGDLANIEDFPYFAYLSVIQKNEKKPEQCGGAIIRPDIILTAAHCIKYARYVLVFVGITSQDDLLRASPYKSRNVISHPYFDWKTSQYDVGLIQLSRNITLDHMRAATIDLAQENPPIGVDAIVVGFGVFKCNKPTLSGCADPISKHLRSAVLRVVKIDGYDGIYTQGVNQNTCNGDSGGPIVYDGEVIGVVSKGQYDNCTGYDTQGPVPSNYEWLAQHMNSL